MPLTIEAFIKCAGTLNALVDNAYLTLDELNEIRARPMKTVSTGLPFVYFFEPSPMEPIQSPSQNPSLGCSITLAVVQGNVEALQYLVVIYFTAKKPIINGSVIHIRIN